MPSKNHSLLDLEGDCFILSWPIQSGEILGGENALTKRSVPSRGDRGHVLDPVH